MENASKALLIAGSVLIAIVLIAVGIKILSSTTGITEQVGKISTTMEASIFNSQFEQYTGEKVSGVQVKSLIRIVLSNNASNQKHQVNVKTGSLTLQDYGQNTYTGAYIQNLQMGINTQTKYKVSLNDFDNEGYVTEIFIDEP